MKRTKSIHAGIVVLTCLLLPTAGQAADAAATDAAADPAKQEVKQENKKPADERLSIILAILTLKVIHPDEVRKAAVQKVEDLGGFPKRVTAQLLDVDVPHDQLEDYLNWLQGQGIVLSKGVQRADRTTELVELEASLRTKREMLQRLRVLFAEASTDATLQIERSMNALVDQIERQQGQLGQLQAATGMAHVQVAFQYRPKQELRHVRSPFAWLETVDIPSFLRRF
jgi:hypothetical protein